MSTALGDLADKLHDIRAKLEKANKAVEEIENEKRDMESQLINAMEAQSLDSFRGKYDTISITRSVKPQLVDYEAFCTFVLRKKALHLFERRISSKAYAEMKESLKGKDVPGLGEFTQVKLSVRKVSKE